MIEGSQVVAHIVAHIGADRAGDRAPWVLEPRKAFYSVVIHTV